MDGWDVICSTDLECDLENVLNGWDGIVCFGMLLCCMMFMDYVWVDADVLLLLIALFAIMICIACYHDLHYLLANYAWLSF